MTLTQNPYHANKMCWEKNQELVKLAVIMTGISTSKNNLLP